MCAYPWWRTAWPKWAASARRPAADGRSTTKTARRPPDPETAAFIEQTAREAGIERRAIGRDEIVDRCIFALVNEGAHLLGEGIALRAADIDVVYLNGYGFPTWRGGPMFYADTVGLKTVLARIEEFRRRHGDDLWQPAPLLRRLAEDGGTFAGFDR